MSVMTAPAPTTTVRDLRTFWRVLIAVALPIGPLLVTILRGIMPYWTNDDTPTIIAKSLAHPDAMNTMAWLSLFVMPPLVISMLAIGYVARRGAPVLATIGATISFLAYVNWSVAGISTFGWVIGHIVGMVLLGIALLQARAVPRWVAIALMVSQPMHLVSAVIIPSRLLDVTFGWGLTTIAFAAIAVTILRTRDEDWDLPPVR